MSRSTSFWAVWHQSLLWTVPGHRYFPLECCSHQSSWRHGGPGHLLRPQCTHRPLHAGYGTVQDWLHTPLQPLVPRWVNIRDKLPVRRRAENPWGSGFTAEWELGSWEQITQGECRRSSWKKNYLLKKWTPGYISHVPVGTCIDKSFLSTFCKQRMTCIWTTRKVWMSTSYLRMGSSSEAATSFLNPHLGILARYQH